MAKLGQFVVDFVKREDGPTAVEYAVMLALIIVVCLVAITALGTKASSTFNSVASTLPGGFWFDLRALQEDWNMSKFSQFALDFLRSEDGPTAVEYAVMLALIIVVCIAAISALGSNTQGSFNKIASTVNTTSS